MPSLLEAADIHELITHRTIGQSCEDTAIDNITAVVVNIDNISLELSCKGTAWQPAESPVLWKEKILSVGT